MQVAHRLRCCLILLLAGVPLATVFAQKSAGAAASAVVSVMDYGVPGAACFPASVRVMLPGKRQVHISRIRPGDEVLGYDAATGQVRPTRVQRLNIHGDRSYQLVQLTIGTPIGYVSLSSAVVSATPAIKLLLTPSPSLVIAARPTSPAAPLELTDKLLRLGESGLETAHLADRQLASMAWEVYNLRTETGNYFVNGVLVSSK